MRKKMISYQVLPHVRRRFQMVQFGQRLRAGLVGRSSWDFSAVVDRNGGVRSAHARLGWRKSGSVPANVAVRRGDGKRPHKLRGPHVASAARSQNDGTIDGFTSEGRSGEELIFRPTSLCRHYSLRSFPRMTCMVDVDLGG